MSLVQSRVTSAVFWASATKRQDLIPDRFPGAGGGSDHAQGQRTGMDRVYLMSVNDYDFPSALGYEKYISERWFVRNDLNLEAEALAQLPCSILRMYMNGMKKAGYQASPPGLR